MTLLASTRLWLLPLIGAALTPGLFAQAPAQQQESSFTGTVVSATRETMVVRSDNGQFQLFVFDRYSVRPKSLAAGSRVRVTSRPTEEPAVFLAEAVALETPAAQGGPPPQEAADRPSQSNVVPVQIRQIESEVERQARRYQTGFRAGIGLDPEVALIGAHFQLGPFFSPDVFFRPNFEFGYGEVSKLVAFNFEGIYRLPLSSRAARWSSYFGAGPALTLVHQNFERSMGGDIDIDFGDWTFDVGLNLLGGVRYRSGMFVELKAGVYSRPAPTMRLILGYNF